MRNFGDARSNLVIHLINVNAPGVGEFLPDGEIGHVLIPRELVRQYPHIARALHVILPTHRPNADVRASQIAGQQRQA